MNSTKDTLDKEIQYIPVGRVRRRRRTWRRTMRDLIRLLMAEGELIGTGTVSYTHLRTAEFECFGYCSLIPGIAPRKTFHLHYQYSRCV